MNTYISVDKQPIPFAREGPSKTYALDLDAGRIVGYVDGIRAVEQVIRKILLTPRFKLLIYDNQYGSETGTVIRDRDATPALIRAEVPRLIEEALLSDGRILRVYDIVFEFVEDALHITCSVDTIFGTTQIREKL